MTREERKVLRAAVEWAIALDQYGALDDEIGDVANHPDYPQLERLRKSHERRERLLLNAARTLGGIAGSMAGVGRG
jgi:hypothetical protein